LDGCAALCQVTGAKPEYTITGLEGFAKQQVFRSVRLLVRLSSRTYFFAADENRGAHLCDYQKVL
jgi:hypothetical protein